MCVPCCQDINDALAKVGVCKAKMLDVQLVFFRVSEYGAYIGSPDSKEGRLLTSHCCCVRLTLSCVMLQAPKAHAQLVAQIKATL